MEKSPQVTRRIEDTIAEVGGEAILECQVTGHPEPRVTFYRNGLPLTSSNKVIIGKLNIFKI